MYLSNETKSYYTESDDTQMMSSRMNDMEYAIDFKGNES